MRGHTQRFEPGLVSDLLAKRKTIPTKRAMVSAVIKKKSRPGASESARMNGMRKMAQPDNPRS